jgi:hypothetical protein
VRRDPAIVVVVSMALLAVALQVLRLTRPNALLSGGSYDTPLYLGSAIRLVHGALPYRDFTLLQPPGLVLVMSPFALLSTLVGSRGALIALSLCTPLLAGANVALVGKLASRRGWRSSLVACGLVAVYPAMYEALLDGLLEPLMGFFCLLGAVLVFHRDDFAERRRLVAGGVAFGFATSILIAGALPTLVVAVLCARRLRSRLLPFAAGAAAGFLVPAIPFLALGPGSLVHDIVVTQLQRVPGAGRTLLSTRLQEMTFTIHGGSLIEALAAVLVAAVVVVVVGLLWAPSRLVPLEWFAIGATLVLGAAQFAIATYYTHFPAMVVPYPAILLGIAVARIARRGWQRLIPAVAVLALAAAVVGLAAKFESMSTVDYGPIADSVIPANGCSLAQKTQVLVQSDRFESTVPGCTALVDPYSTFLAYEHSEEGLVSAYSVALHHTDYLALGGTLAHFLHGPLSPLQGYVTQHFRPYHSGPLTIYVRDGFPVE